MSFNQSRAEKSEAQLRKSGRSGSSSQQRSFTGGSGKGGGGTAPPTPSSVSSLSSSLSANRSFKKYSNGQGGQSRVGLTTANSEPSAAVTASHSVQNSAHVQSQLHDAQVSGITKSIDSSIPRSPQGLPRTPSSQSAAGASGSMVPTTPSKGDVSRPFPLQFGSISPGFMNDMQIPARTSSAPPNLDEQKRDQARYDSFRAVPTSPIPSAPKQQHQLRKDVGSLNQSSTVEHHPPAMAKRDVHVQSTAVPAAATTQKSSVLPVAGTSMPIPFRPPQVPVQFGGHSPQIQSQGIPPSSLQMSMQLPVGNTTQIQEQVFVSCLQSHPLQPHGIMHQGQSLGFASQMGHQLVPQLGNLGIGMPTQFAQQQPGKFGGPRKTVKITHPETHEELKLDKRTESYMEVGSSGTRSHLSVPIQSQPVTSFPVNYYLPIQPNSYNPTSIFFPTSTSLPLTSTQMTPGSSALGYTYPISQGGKNVSFMNASAPNPLSFNKAGHPMHEKSETMNLEQVYDGHAVSVSAPPTIASVQVTLKPAVGSLAANVGTTSVTVTSPVSKIESPKLLKQSGEASITHHVRDSEVGLENCVQQPKSVPKSSDSIPLPAIVKHSTPPVAVSTQEVPPSALSVPVIPAERSASVVTNAESRRREYVRRSDSLKDQQKKPSKKELRHFQQQHQTDAPDSAGNLMSSSLKISMDSSSSDLNDGQVHTNPDERVHNPSEAAATPTTTIASSFSSSLEHNCCSVVGVSKSEEAKGLPFKSETSGVVLERATNISQDLSSNCNASKTTTDGAQVGEGGPCKPSDPSGFEADRTTCGNLDAAHCVIQDDSAPLEFGLKKETTVTMEHREIEMPDYSPHDSGNLKVGATVSESSELVNQTEEMSQIGAATDNMQETDVDESSCTQTEHIDMKVEAAGCNLEVEKTKGNTLCSSTIRSGSVNAETAPSTLFLLKDSYECKTSPEDTSKTTSGKSTASQEEVTGILSQETAPTPPSVSSEAAQKLEGRVTERSSGGQISTTLLGSKDRTSVEQNQARGTPAKKKKRKEFLKKADAAGRTSDLYLAYKGPEEKQETSVTSESKGSSPPANVKQESADDAEKDVTAEDDRQSKGEVDDWEDAAEISAPKLKASQNREPVRGAQKQNDGYRSGITGKKYTRDFLLTFSEQCTDLPAGFDIGSDLVDALMSAKVPVSHLDRESYPNSGRIIDRTIGGSRLDRRGFGTVDDGKWNKAPGPFASGHDPRLDAGFGVAGINFRPGQGGNHGVLRNPRGQSSTHFVGVILAGPMQSLASPGGMPRNGLDADRWQRATGKGLIPPPQTPSQVMHRAEKKYEVGKVSDEEAAKQRLLKAILNKLTPQNFDKLFEQVKAVNIDNTTTLTNVISQIFDKALMEPTFCEMYADFCFHLATVLPDFSEDNEKITFKRLLLNKCQEEFERGEREQAEANRDEEDGEIKRSQEEKEEKKVQARRRMLGNIRLIGELYKKKMLTERIMHECIKKLQGQNQNPDEEDIEALCKLMSTIGEMIDHPKAKEHMDAYFDVMLKLSNNQKLSTRVRFMLKDVIDLRKNRWQQRRKVEGPKKIEEVHRAAAQERQARATRLPRGSAVGSSARRGQPLDYGARAATMLSSLNAQQMGSIRGLPPQIRGYGTQDVRMEDRHSFESRTLSVPLPQRPIDDDSITLGPQGGLARGMSVRGQPLMSNAPLADVSSCHGESRRMISGPNGHSYESDWSSYNNSREELVPRYVPDRFVATPPYGQSNSQDWNANFGNRDLRNEERSFDRSMATTPAAGSVQGPSTGIQSAPSEQKVSTERLRERSIAAIWEFYSARNEEEVRLCIKELNYPSFYPDMVMLWVNDSFDRKNDIDRDLLAKLLVNLCKSQDSLLNQVQLSKGFESVLFSLEDAVTDSPKAAEYLGRIFGIVILENALSLGEIGRLIHGGGEEPGSLLQSGLASDVLVSILEIIRREKGESVLNEIRTNSNLRLEDFRSPDSIKSRKLDAFI